MSSIRYGENMAMAIMKMMRAAATGLVLTFGAAFSAQAEDFSKPDIEKIVREYLLANPELIQEALVALEQKRRDEENVARAQTIKNQSRILFDSVHQAELGNPKGDVTLVEFFDYNCGFCKRSFPDMVRLLEEDPNLRIVMKEFPVLGQGSVEAAQVSVAVQQLAPEKYMDFHATMISQRGQASKAAALDVAEQIGMDRGEVEKLVNAAEINIPIEEVYALANGLGLTGTPSYVVGDEVVMGAVGFDALREKIQAYRQCGSTTC